VMIKDRNDTPELAHTTWKLLRNRKAHLNLIPYNQNPAIELDESTPERIRKFQQIVMSYDVPVTVRQNMWRKVKSACGQLGWEKIQEEVKKGKG
jgi:23S rRNA (adenine2503-C2)-methyltransferase